LYHHVVCNQGIFVGLFENILLHTDRDLYLSGEIIWFNAYCSIEGFDTIENISNVLYVELFDSEKKPLVRKKYKISDGITYGLINIPDALHSGKYFLRAYTQLKRNYSAETYYTKEITILNPEIRLYENIAIDPLKTSVTAEDSIQNLSPETVHFSICTDRETYSTKKKIELKIEGDQSSDYGYCYLSVSVVKKGTLIGNKNLSYVHQKIHDDEIVTSAENFQWIPEIRDVSISGIVKNKNSGKPASGILVIASTLGNNPQIHFIETGENGEFVFSLSHLTSLHNISLSVDNNTTNELEILVNNDFSINYPVLPESSFVLDSTYRQLIEEMYVNHQVSNSYNSGAKILADTIDSLPFLFGQDIISILLDDYIDLSTMQEVFNEIIPYVRVSQSKGEYLLKVLDSKTEQLYADPLVLIDNIPVFDINEVMEIHPSKIKEIKVINKTYYIGGRTLQGIVLINSFTDNFAGINLPKESVFVEYQTITPSEFCKSPDHGQDFSGNNRNPDFRTTLFWKPDLLLQQNDTTLSFFASDHCSEYDVVIRGLTSDGKHCYGKTSFLITKE